MLMSPPAAGTMLVGPIPGIAKGHLLLAVTQGSGPGLAVDMAPWCPACTGIRSGRRCSSAMRQESSTIGDRQSLPEIWFGVNR